MADDDKSEPAVTEKPTSEYDGQIVSQRHPIFMKVILSRELDINRTFGFTKAMYAGPPYNKLSGAGESIRLLMLAPGDFDDDIAGFLIEVPVASKPRYAALSYVWGDPKDTIPIKLFDQDIPVTKNLEAALRYIRSDRGYIPLWVDAVCINQSDIPEKNDQLPLMGSIYRNAADVVVWLGKDVEPDHDNWPGSARRTEMAFAWANEVARMPLELFKMTAIIQRMGHDYPDADDGLRSYMNLLGRPWFSRRWIIQEVVLSQPSRVEVRCGQHRISWMALSNASKRLVLSLEALPPRLEAAMRQMGLAVSTIESIRSLHTQWTSAKGNSEVLIAILLSITGGLFHVSDLRDRIFGLLGFVEGSANDSRFQADYTLSEAEVFTSFARRLFEHHGSIKYLLSTLPRDFNWPAGSLPSWVPMWASKEQNMVSIAGAIESLIGRPSSEDPRNCAKPSFPGDGLILRTEAYIIGRLHYIGSCSSEVPEYSAAAIATFREWEEQILELPLVKQRYTADRTPAEVFKHTLMHSLPTLSASGFPTAPEETTSHMPIVNRHRMYDFLMGRGEVNRADEEIFRSKDEILGYIFEIVQQVAEDSPFVTTDGDIGITRSACSVELKPDDVVCFIQGCRLPLLLRPEGSHFTLLGPCYVGEYLDPTYQTSLISENPPVSIDIR